MGTYTYWCVADGKEKPFQRVLVHIGGFKHKKNENIPQNRLFELILQWYLNPLLGYY
jgi:hypothetical protein